MLRKFVDVALQVLFPRVCPICGKILIKSEMDEENPFVCKYCRKKILYVKEPTCFICGKPIDDETEEVCGNCKKIKRYFDRGISLFAHNDDSRKIIYSLKYGGRKDNADFIGRELALVLGEKILAMEVDAIIPVPLHEKRQFERGFNQAELIAEKFLKNLKQIYGESPPIDSEILIRQGKTKRQKNLSTLERAQNVKNKFCINKDAIYQRDENGEIIRKENGMLVYKNYKNVLLIDDIFTSGATLNECAKTLKEAGVREVCFLTVSTVA